MAKINPIRDIATLIASEPSVQRGLLYGQGVIVAWNPTTFANQVEFRGITLTNLPILGKIDGLSLKSGDVVGLMGWAPNGGMGSWWILGELAVPPLSEPVAIEGGASLFINDNVDGGGNIIIDGAGRLYAGDSADDRFIAVGNGEIQMGQHSTGQVAVELNFNPFLARLGLDIFNNGFFRINKHDDDGTGLTLILASELSPGVFTVTHSFGPASSTLAHATTGAGTPNIDMLSNGFIRRITSSRRYKVDIKDFRVNPRMILDMKPRAWRDRAAVAKDPENDEWAVGFVAEELDDLGLSAFVRYDHLGRPDSIAYDRLSVGLLEVVKHQQRQIDQLTTWAKSQGFKPAANEPPATTELPKAIDKTRSHGETS